MKMSEQKINRYPGVVPFDEKQQAIFFGRDNDIEKLTRLIRREQQVLLYAKSGLGKSSLVNAGVLPILRKEMIPIKVRFGAYTDNSQTVTETMRGFLPDTSPSFISEKLKAQNLDFSDSIWLDFKALQAQNDQTYLLVLDQFEEVFSYPPEQITEFKRQMADVLQREVPLPISNAIEQAQRQNPNFLTEAQEDFVWQKPKVKMLIIIREDRYSLLNQLTDHLPYCLDNRYNLSPLTQAQARDAIVLPAQKPKGEDFATEAFTYQPEALTKILNFLTKGGHVETTQLQILCSRLESLGLPQISERDIPNFDDIFLQFYEECIAQIPDKAEQLRARRFVENELIKKAQRTSVDALACTEYVSEGTLKILIDKQHLLRAETNSRGSQIYELAHDSLIDPILLAKERREAEEAKLEEERRQAEALREAQEKAEKDRIEKEKTARQLRIVRSLLIAAVVALVLAIGAGWYAFEQKKEADKQTQIAINKEKEALREKEKAQKALKDFLGVKIKELDDAINTFTQSGDKNLVKKYTNSRDSLQKQYDLINLELQNTDKP
jgi:hypothetical protein